MYGGEVIGVMFMIVWLAMMFGMVAGWVVLLIAVWRGMKAHESLAQTAQGLYHLERRKATAEKGEFSLSRRSASAG